MKPSFSASITVSGGTFIDIYFSQPLAPETANKIKDLEKYSGVKIRNQLKGYGFWVTFPSIWSAGTVVEEITNILVAEGFDRSSILVK